MSAPVKPWDTFDPLVSVNRADKLLVVDVSDTTEGPSGTVKVAEIDDVGSVFQQEIDAAAAQVALATTQANNAQSSANAAAGSAAAAAEIVNISQVQTFTNPLARAIAVQMTAAASGSNGIQVLSSSTYDLATSDATIHWRGSIASNLSGSEVHRFVGKYQNSDNRWQITYTPSTKTLAVQVNKAGSLIFLATTVLPVALPLNTVFDYHAVIIRETASSAGSVTFYINGVSVGSATIAAAATVDISNTGNLNISGNTLFAPLRGEGSTHGAAIYNRALDAPTVLDYTNNGPALSERGAGQTIATSWTWANFGGASGYETFTTSGSDITSAINTAGLGIASAAYTLTNRKTFRVRLNITVNSGSVAIASAPTTDLSSGSQT
jgi:hypothetical protein